MSPPAEFAPVRVGVAGLGRAGMFHVERIGLRDDCRLVALYDDCPAVRKRAASEAELLHGDWNAFLADRDVELVLLATPPALHAELAIAALAAGKHVLVETPLGLNRAEADAVIAASRRAGRSVSVAHTRRWDDDYRTASMLLMSGELGRPLAMKLVNWHYNPPSLRESVPSGRLADAVADDDGLSPVDWRRHAASGGGALWEFGVHYFDQLLQMAGASPLAVYARLFPSSAEPADDGFLAVVTFPGGLTAHIEVHRASVAPLSTGWTIVGEGGSYANFTQFTATPAGEVVDVPLSPRSGTSDEFYGLLARHLRLGEPLPVPAQQARAVITLIEAVRQSATSGHALQIDA
jgi:scyllo-inositol 2-dehydrogenase (NADP+)